MMGEMLPESMVLKKTSKQNNTSNGAEKKTSKQSNTSNGAEKNIKTKQYF